MLLLQGLNTRLASLFIFTNTYIHTIKFDVIIKFIRATSQSVACNKPRLIKLQSVQGAEASPLLLLPLLFAGAHAPCGLLLIYI